VDTREAANRWADCWRRGWEAHDADLVASVYADDCLFLSHPFREPQRPRDYVVWAFTDEESAEPWFGEPIVDGDRAAVEWRAFVRAGGRESTLAGTSLLRFRSDGLCVEHREAWAEGEGRLERR
jgi:ketosteroid isomerase-like protein